MHKLSKKYGTYYSYDPKLQYNVNKIDQAWIDLINFINLLTNNSDFIVEKKNNLINEFLKVKIPHYFRYFENILK